MKDWKYLILAMALLGVVAAAPTVTAVFFTGSSSGTGTLQAPAAASTYVWTLPPATASLAYKVGSLVNGNCLQASGTSGGIADAGAPCGTGGSGLTIGSTTITSGTTNRLLYDNSGVLGELILGSTLANTAGTLDTKVTDTSHAGGFSSWNAGGQDDMSASGTATFPALTAGQSLLLTTQSGAVATLSASGITLNGLASTSTLRQFGFLSCAYNASSVYSCFGFPGFGTITSGALMKFAGADGAATAGDLSGDVTTSGSLVTTVAKIAGVAVGTPTGTTNVVFSASPALTGTPTAPTASVGTNTTQLATTAFVQASTRTDEICATWDSTTAVTAQTIDFPIAWATYTMTSVKSKVGGGGSFTVALKIGGTNVTSCSAISVSGATNTSTTCTAANTGSANDIISLVVSSPSGTVNQAYVCPVFTHTAN